MIYLVTRELHPHSGMKTFAAGLRVVGGGLVEVVDMTHATDIRARAFDLVVFDDSIGPDGQELVSRWAGLGVNFAVLIHSPLLQMDVSNELDALIPMLESQAVSLVLTADEELAPILRHATGCAPTAWLPHCVPVVPPRSPRQYRPAPGGSSLLWLPLTLPDDDPYYRHKNAICQIAAAALCDGSVTIATNTASPRLRQAARLLSVPLREMGHIPQVRFDAHLDGVSVGMCVSLAESFCYNAVEMMLRGLALGAVRPRASRAVRRGRSGIAPGDSGQTPAPARRPRTLRSSGNPWLPRGDRRHQAQPRGRPAAHRPTDRSQVSGSCRRLGKRVSHHPRT